MKDLTRSSAPVETTLSHVLPLIYNGSYFPVSALWAKDVPPYSPDTEILIYEWIPGPPWSRGWNLAVVSDTCDGVPEGSDPNDYVEAFNRDLRPGEWLDCNTIHI
jgi:hypothetical protein